LLGTGTAATAAVTSIGLAGFSGGESVISYDTADWFLPVDGQIIDGVAHGFTMGGNSSTDATVDIGPGVLDYVEPFSVEGDAAGVLTLVGIFAMRWNVVIGGQLFSKSFLGYTTYKMAFATREGLLPAILLMILPFGILWVLVKLLPPWHDEPAAGA